MEHARKTAGPRPTTPRVEPVERVAELARAYNVGRLVAPVNLAATLAHAKPVSKGIEALSAVFFDPALIDPRLREVVILRTGWNTQSVYEFGQHVMAGRKVGMTDEEIRATTRPIGEGAWTALEAAAMQMADDLCADDCVTDETWQALVETTDDTRTAIALVALCGMYRMVAGVLNSLGIQPEPDLPRWP